MLLYLCLFTHASDIASLDNFCDELDGLREQMCLNGTSTPRPQHYYTGLDYDVIFEDSSIRVLIADMYTAIATPDFLEGVKYPYSSVGPIDVIINLLGSPQFADNESQLRCCVTVRICNLALGVLVQIGTSV